MTHPLVKAATSLRDAAQTHKRLSAQHRRKARQLMAEYAELEQACRQLGIRLDLQPSEDGDRHG